jgi:aryl-alcohol dehydrogenase-like predicted oxidoreductase
MTPRLLAPHGLTLPAYSPLKGDLRPSPRGHAGWLDHSTSQQRLAVLREVAAELGTTPSQVVLAWLMQGRPSMIPVVGASSVAQLDELLAAVDLHLDEDVGRTPGGQLRCEATAPSRAACKVSSS